MTDNELLRMMCAKYGDAQLIVAIEELSELQKELTKYLRGRRDPISLAEEIADVRLMLEQVIILCGVNRDDLHMWRKTKLGRLEDMLRGESYSPDELAALDPLT